MPTCGWAVAVLCCRKWPLVKVHLVVSLVRMRSTGSELQMILLNIVEIVKSYSLYLDTREGRMCWGVQRYVIEGQRAFN